MVRGMNAVSLRVLGKEWTKVSCHADSALAPRCSNPDHHLAGASLASLTTRENNHGPWKRLPVMDSRRSAAGDPPARPFLALRNIRLGCWHRMGPRRGRMLTRPVRDNFTCRRNRLPKVGPKINRRPEYAAHAPACRYVAANIVDVSFEPVMNFGVLQLLERTSGTGRPLRKQKCPSASTN
jgi:hypothetical protein